MTTAQPHMLIGQRYHVIGALGQGAGSDVLRGEDIVLQRPVAVRLVRPPFASAYRAALGTLARVGHPAFVGVYDALDHESRLAIVQEFCGGQTFTDLAEADLSPATVARVGRQIALALAHAHLHGVTHGDLTPAAIMRDQWRAIRVNNLALPPDRDYFALAGRLLAPGAEAWATATLGPRDDLRALGVLLWLLLAHRVTPPEDLTGLASDWDLVGRPVPEPLSDLIERLADPTHPRALTTAEEVVRALDGCLRAIETRDPARLQPPWERPPDAHRDATPPPMPAVPPRQNAIPLVPTHNPPLNGALVVGPPLAAGSDDAPTWVGDHAEELAHGGAPTWMASARSRGSLPGPAEGDEHGPGRRDVVVWAALGVALFLFWLAVGYLLPGLFGK